ncbi:MAG: ribulose-phosphate 3-epimerase [Candidatus Izemoplasmatales bacterium]
MICSPSFLSSDFNILKEEILSISKARWLHFDVMDGKFVENKTYDYKLISEVKTYSNQFFDVHLMIEKPEEYLTEYIKAGADLITFHLEATDKPLELIKIIKEHNVLAGISIKPNTSVNELDSLLPYLDLVLVMSVEPGKGGQKFIPESVDRILYLDRLKREFKYKYLIEVDGGININTAKTVRLAGCDVIVVGSYLFNQANRNELIEALENV